MDENIKKEGEEKIKNGPVDGGVEFFVEPKNTKVDGIIPEVLEVNNDPTLDSSYVNSGEQIKQENKDNKYDNINITEEIKDTDATNNPKNEIEQKQENTTSSSKDPNSLEALLSNVGNEFPVQKKEKFSININTFDDVLKIILNNEYDYVVISPEYEKVKIIFKKDEKDIDEKFISYPIYSNVLIKIKTLVNIDSDRKKPQEGKGKYKFDKKDFEIDVSTIPESFGEKIILKAKLKIKNKASINDILTFTGALSFIIFILSSSFITFIVMNAQNVEDVIFFSSLGISLNDINDFIGKVVNLVFSSVIFIEVILFAVFGIKFIMTKKEYKKKRLIFGALATFFLMLTFISGNLWIVTIKKVKNLPNWQEMSFGEIQLYDNTKLLLEGKYEKKDALIAENEYGTLIGPITIKFDLTYYAKREEKSGYKIEKFIWDFGDGEMVEEITPIIIREFNDKKTYNIKVYMEIRQLDGKKISKQVDNVPSIGIKNLVKINEQTLNSGGKKITFDASDLRNLGKIEWYTDDNLDTPVITGESFTPGKPIFTDKIIGLIIKKEGKENINFDKVFLITGIVETKMNGSILEEKIDNDLVYEFKVINADKLLDNGYIEEYKWIIGDTEKVLKNEVGNEEDSSRIKHTFTDYGKKEIRVILTDTYGKTKEIKKIIEVIKQVKLKNNLLFNDNGEKLIPRYENGVYYIQDLPIPTTLKFDARLLKTENALDSLQKVVWEIDGKTRNGNTFDYKIETEGKILLNVTYLFKNIKDSKENTVKEVIYINSIKKDALLDLEIKPSEEEYVPVTIQFDASKSEIKDENITKFIFDYGDGTPPEEKDAINKGHRYTLPGDYNITLTAITATGKKYSISKKLILKPRPQLAKIKVSMKEAPVNQGIDFLSSESEGQVISYYWDFGDGESSTEANPTHSFNDIGTYKVKLKLEFSNKNVLEDTIIINIVN